MREHREAAEPLVAGRSGRIVKTMGDGLLLEFPSVVDAVACAIAIQKLMVARSAEIPEAKRIVYRVALAERAGAGSATPPRPGPVGRAR